MNIACQQAVIPTITSYNYNKKYLAYNNYVSGTKLVIESISFLLWDSYHNILILLRTRTSFILSQQRNVSVFFQAWYICKINLDDCRQNRRRSNFCATF